MTDNEDKQFVEIPTMTIRKPKKKQTSSGMIVIIGVAAMVIGLIILAIAIIFWL